MKPTRIDAVRLFHEGALACAQIESNGIRIDTGYLETTMEDIAEEVHDLEQWLMSTKTFAKWRNYFGDKTKLGSSEQLAHVVFNEMGFEEVKDRTDTGKIKADKSAFEHIEHPFLQTYFRIKVLKNMRGTFLHGIRKEVCDGYLHPNINLNIPRTYRSSYNQPNFQNNPLRDPEMGALIRRCFIPRKGNCVAEDDLVGAEVRVAGCYNGDQKFINDVLHGDMHTDVAALLFKLPKNRVNKVVRFIAKSFFVFAEFYGDYYVHCAKNIWAAMVRLKATVEQADGTSITLREHLKRNGIGELGACNPDRPTQAGTFEAHVKSVEDTFWNKTYTAYTQWKKDWYAKYLERGYFDMLTGFRVDNYHKRNDVINYPIQGSSFHCLLWTLIRLQNWLNKYNMRTKILGQIHDSIVADVYEPELQDYLAAVEFFMTEALPKAWPWIVVPLAIEAEVSPLGMSWFDKKEWVPNNAGIWEPKV